MGYVDKNLQGYTDVNIYNSNVIVISFIKQNLTRYSVVIIKHVMLGALNK